MWIHLQIIKFPTATPLPKLPSWFKRFLLTCCFLVPIFVLLRPYAYTANQVKQDYQTALAKGDYKTAYDFLDHHYPGISYDTFKHWQNQFSTANSLVTVHKVPTFLNRIYTWRVDLPTRTMPFELPFPNASMSIDGITYQVSSMHASIPLFVGEHTVSIQAGEVTLGQQTIFVSNELEQRAIAIVGKPSTELLSTIKTFLIQYNNTWCQAVSLQSPDGILPFLTGKQSSEYQFLSGYIRILANRDWVREIETLKDLQITQIKFENSSHVLVTTKETYHHAIHAVKDHDTWKHGDEKQYDSTVSWTYTIKLTNPQILQIDALSHLSHFSQP